MGALEVEAFLTYLATQRHVSSACISEASYTTLDCYQLHEMDYVAPFNTAMISLHPVFFDKPAIRNFLLGVWRFAYTPYILLFHKLQLGKPVLEAPASRDCHHEKM